VARVALEIPKIGLVMENARLVRWLKNVGDPVKQGEPLVELETEKSVVEIESTESGLLVEILLQADQEAHVGDRIAWLENDAVETAVAAPMASAAAASKPPSALPSAAPAVNRADDTARIRSSPVARRLAAEHAADLRLIKGSGPRGRVQLNDVRRAVEAQSAHETAAAAPAGLQPLSAMRRAVARSITLSNATVPQFFVERALDWTAIRALRAQLLAQLPAGAARPSVNDFLLQGMARTLLSFPALNATFWGDADSPDAGIVPASGAHIGLVVAVETGLIVPVLHEVEQLGLAELTQQRSDIVKRALKGNLKREQLEGATISLSNLGARGPDRFNAIINPPQSAVLAVGRERDCVVAVNGSIHVRPMSQLTLTVDHRVADGRLASDFLKGLVEQLEGDAWRLN
jgi:pyruvate dehydrogenase E2 component (dihydrolipoamide acetyltransferase)